MKVLWCTQSMPGFKPDAGYYNGCGWISALLDEFHSIDNIELGVAFYFDKLIDPIVYGGVTFFPILQKKVGVTGKIKTFFGDYSCWKSEDNKHLVQLHSVIERFSPDVIHVWGTETDMGLIAREIDIPVVVHLQGLLQPYKNALCPPFVSRFNYIFKDGYSLISILKNFNNLKYWEYKADRELRIFRACKHYFGRTHWDKAISKFFNSESHYYYCSEMLRPEFYTDIVWDVPTNTDCFRIVSTISPPLYKGADLILKTAKLLKNNSDFNFEWNVIGVNQINYAEHITGITAEQVNVKCIGIKGASEIKDIELNSHLYFHPSYIDNSPNSVCEAQRLGMPVIATNVGGVTTILDNGKTGWLVPPNDPYMAASLIVNFVYNKTMLVEKRAVTIKAATARHEKSCIINSLLNGYKAILQHP